MIKTGNHTTERDRLNALLKTERIYKTNELARLLKQLSALQAENAVLRQRLAEAEAALCSIAHDWIYGGENET